MEVDSRLRNSAITVALLGLVALSWSNWIDERADAVTAENLKQALAVFALARTFNGVISVAQETEFAIQPVGVGVTLTPGEILDSLNDLLEQFSALALLASVSLGLQLTLGKIMASPMLSGVITIVVVGYLGFRWASKTSDPELDRSLNRIPGLSLFVRFLLATVLLCTWWIDAQFLQGIQDRAVANLTATSGSIRAINAESTPLPPEPESGFLDRTADGISRLLDTSRDALDVENQLERLQEKAEASIEELINLIVVFLLQTLLIPIATLYACGWLLRWYWQSVTR